MSLSDPALMLRAEHDTLTASGHNPIPFTFDDRHWRVRGLESQLSCQRLKVNLMVSRQELTHIDTLDLYTSRQRRMFLREAAAELYVDEALLKRDLGRVLLELEQRQELLIKDTLQQQEPDVPPMTEAERDEALQFLKDPQLTQRILEDYAACGLVGEATNKLVSYLAGTSRLLDRPLSVLVQSSSAAGKTSLLEATLALMPPEAQVRMSSLTGQALYYMGTGELKHKILSVAEEAGVAEATYALKLLQSDGRLQIATVGKDSGSGRSVTQHYEVEGPVAMLLTTTAEHPDPELANRCLVLSVDEEPQQTRAIQDQQRADYLPDDEQDAADADRHACRQRHHHAQRLLEPLPVVMPFARQLTFRSDQTRYRRDHAKYLSLIAASALLHQYQRPRTTRRGRRSIVATGDDVAWANQLASGALGAQPDPLLSQTRRLLEQLNDFVTRCAAQQQIARHDVRFTQRQLRETLEWQDRALRRQLTRLVELEYVLVYRSGRGNGRVYQLLYEPQPENAPSWQLGIREAPALDGWPRKATR
jgi:DNA primase